MRNLVIGFILGLVVAAVGFSGLARIFDKGVQTIQTQSKELAQLFEQKESKLLQKMVDLNIIFCYNIDMLSSNAKHFLTRKATF
jgi:capsular polysaccharide biosynthesis protein